MKWIIFVFSLLPTIYCYHQKWQALSDYQKDLLFPNVTVDTAAFYDAENMTDVENLCEETANEVEPPEDREAAANACTTFFFHRKEAQRWLDQLFKVLPQYNISVANSAKLKSWFWMIDAKSDSMAETIYCFKKEKYRSSIPVVVWKKLDAVFDQILKDHPEIGTSAYNIFSYETDRRKALENSGVVLRKHYCD